MLHFMLFGVADDIVVLVERKLMSYVYAVGKQPTSNLWCKIVERGKASCEMWEYYRYAFCLFMYIKLWLNIFSSTRIYARTLHSRKKKYSAMFAN